MSGGPRHFVHVFATFGAGGPQVRAVQLIERLGAAAVHTVRALDGNTDALAMLSPAARVTLAPPAPRRGLLGSVAAARTWLRAQRPDLVLTYNWGAIESAIAARSLGLPLVHHEDGFLPDEAVRRLRRRTLLRRFALRSVPVVVPSAVLQRIATAEWRLPAAQVHHLPNGVDLQRFRAAAGAGAETAGVVGTVGGLRGEKDHATLLRAFAALEPGVARRLDLVGGGPLDGELRALAQQLGLGARVRFTGPVRDTAPCYAELGVFVLSSRTEQMPLALLEAMACGLPVVATDVGDVRAMLPPSAQDLIVPREDPAALAAALRRVLADAELRRRLGADNRRRVEQHYEAGTCLDRFVALYDRAAAAPR
ncbi:MAG: glycosyltransferase [Planctomycetes bacterium]|nr:glycosyltransferase [Planctomycetota bacterium]